MDRKINIVFILSDDHACSAISAYNPSAPQTPHIDALATSGAKLNRCYCTNSLCAPSRASILTGLYSHLNGVKTLKDEFYSSQETFIKRFHDEGYQTAIIGKWHLGHGQKSLPQHFDYWDILEGQGEYYDPEFISSNGRKIEKGYCTNLITQKSIAWLEGLNAERPFVLLCHHKAPHRPWQADKQYADKYSSTTFPLPKNFNDNYLGRCPAARDAKMRIEDLTENDCKNEVPEGLSEALAKEWKFQRFMQDYHACIASVDDSVGVLCDYLEQRNWRENTLVIYASDQGFFLGEHGWFDKRFMYEESLQMPFLISCPKLIPAGKVSDIMVENIDFSATLLDLAFPSLSIKHFGQGRSFAAHLTGEKQGSFREFTYYHYWQYPSPHNVYPHYGIRSQSHKLIRFYRPEEEGKTTYWWEFYNLEDDPLEMCNLIDEPSQNVLIQAYKKKLEEIQRENGDLMN